MSAEWIPAITAAAKEGGLLQQIYGDLAKPGVAQVGKALSTVLGLGNTVLWPTQLLNEKARIALDANLDKYREKLAGTPEQDISPVPTEIGVPLVEKLGYVQDVDLRELYTNLLASASKSQSLDQAHPSFVNVINNMSPDEARVLKHFKSHSALPFVAAQFTNPETGHWMQVADLIAPTFPDLPLAFPGNFAAYITNLDGLGLLSVRRDIFVVPETVYDPLEAEVKSRFGQVVFEEYPVLNCIRGRIDLTHFGQLFIKACVQ